MVNNRLLYLQAQAMNCLNNGTWYCIEFWPLFNSQWVVVSSRCMSTCQAGASLFSSKRQGGQDPNFSSTFKKFICVDSNIDYSCLSIISDYNLPITKSTSQHLLEFLTDQIHLTEGCTPHFPQTPMPSLLFSKAILILLELIFPSEKIRREDGG